MNMKWPVTIREQGSLLTASFPLGQVSSRSVDGLRKAYVETLRAVADETFERALMDYWESTKNAWFRE